MLVVFLGVGMVFVGLISIIAICYLMGAIIGAFVGNKPATAENAAAAQPEAVADPAGTANRQELVAAISAAVAEQLGKDVSAIRIKSIRKL